MERGRIKEKGKKKIKGRYMWQLNALSGEEKIYWGTKMESEQVKN